MTDLTKVTDIVVDGVDMNDYPDFCDAFVLSAKYNGVDMTPDELDEINEDNTDFVQEQVWESLER